MQDSNLQEVLSDKQDYSNRINEVVEQTQIQFMDEEEVLSFDEAFPSEVQEELPSVSSDTQDDEIYYATGQQDLDVNSAKNHVLFATSPLNNYINKALDQRALAEEVERNYANIETKQNDFINNPQFYYEQALAQGDDSVDPVDLKLAMAQRISQDIIAEYEDQEETGIMDRALDFASYVIRDVTIGIPENLTKRSERLGAEFLYKAADPNVSLNEFAQWARGQIDDVMSEGLRENNANTLAWLKSSVLNYGYDPQADLVKYIAILDLVGLGSTAKAGLKAVAKTAKPRTITAKISSEASPEEAADVAADIARKRVDPVVEADAGPSATNLHPPATPVTEGHYARILKKDKLVQKLSDLINSGSMGRALTKDEIALATSKFADRFKQRVGNPIYDQPAAVDTGFGNQLLRVDFGKAADGNPYAPLKNGEAPASVKRLAERTGGQVAKVTNEAGELKGYVVRFEENLDLSKVSKDKDFTLDYDPDELLRMERGIVRKTMGRVFGNFLMGSTALRGVERTNVLANLGKDAQGAVRNLIEQEYKKIDALTADEFEALDSITRGLRDGAEATERVWFSDLEFANKFKAYTGKQADERIISAYNATVSLDNARYILNANNTMRRFVEKGYKTLTLPNGFRIPSKIISKDALSSDDFIIDIASNTRLRKSELDEGVDVWKLHDDYEGIMYASRPNKVDALDPGDVLGYNAGGPRFNPKANYFVVVGDLARGRVKSLMSTFTKTDADTAVEQLNNIRRAILDEVDDIDEIIKNNSDWNPSIQTLKQFQDESAKNGWNLSDEFEISVKPRNQSIEEVAPDDVYYRRPFSEFVENDMRRNDKVLPQFGGGLSHNMDPMNSIMQGLGTAVNEFATNAYNFNAMAGWVKKAKKEWLPSGYSPEDYRGLFLNAKVTGTDPFSRRMRELQAIERRRMGVKSETHLWMESLGQQLSEYVFDTTGGRIATRIGDPSNALLNVGFQSAFGFFNISQFLIQGSHATTIMAISPKHGMRGASMTLALRSLYHQSGEALELGVQRAAKFYDMEPEEIKEIMEYVRTSGRSFINGDAIEQGTGISWGVSSFNGESLMPRTVRKTYFKTKKVMKKGLDKGLYPFQAGEYLGRLTGTYTSILEFKAKNPGVPLTSERARYAIARRDHDLTFNMTNTGRPMIQSGLMRVPTQWLSHSFRAMEEIFVGRNFTRMERARMATVLIPMYGTAGFGFSSAADMIADYYDMDPESSGFTFLKWGMVDWIGDVLMPDDVGKEGIGLSKRLSPVGAIVDTYRKITQDQFLEVALGPSGQIAKSAGDAFMNVMSKSYDTRGVALTEDIITLLRQPSGLDNIAKAVGIFNNGEYRSKNGVTLPTEMSTTEGFFQLLGVGSLKTQEYYEAKSIVYNSEKKLKKFRKEINKYSERAYSLIESSDQADKERGFKLMHEIDAMIKLSGFSPEQQKSLTNTALRKDPDSFLRTYQTLLRHDRDFTAQRTAATLGR